MRSEIGTHPLYEIEHDGRKLALFHPGVGAPLAAALLEEVIARGCRKFIACGGAGVLDGESPSVISLCRMPRSAMKARPITICRRAAR